MNISRKLTIFGSMLGIASMIFASTSVANAGVDNVGASYASRRLISSEYLLSPGALAFGEKNKFIYVVETQQSKGGIVRFDSNGENPKKIADFKNFVGSLKGLGVASNGDIYALTNRRGGYSVYLLKRDSYQINKVLDREYYSAAYGIYVDPKFGDLHVPEKNVTESHDHGVAMYKPDRSLSTRFLTHENTIPQAVGFGPDREKYIFTVNSKSNGVVGVYRVKINENDRPFLDDKNGITDSYGVAVDGAGSIFVSATVTAESKTTSKLQEFNSDAKFLEEVYHSEGGHLITDVASNSDGSRVFFRVESFPAEVWVAERSSSM